MGILRGRGGEEPATKGNQPVPEVSSQSVTAPCLGWGGAAGTSRLADLSLACGSRHVLCVLQLCEPYQSIVKHGSYPLWYRSTSAADLYRYSS